MMKIFLSLCLTFELFYFSEGKSCPEKYRPHKTQCDAYFKCIILKTKSYLDNKNIDHIWITKKCNRGLIFEPNLKLCVLPDNNWECQLNDDIKMNLNNNNNNNNDDDDENNIYGINSLEIFENISDNNMESLKNYQNNNKESEINNNKITEFIEVKSNDNNDNIITNDSNNIINIDFIQNTDIDKNYEASGDGFIDESTSIQSFDNDIKETKEINLQLSTTSIPTKSKNQNFDPKLTEHLQRLTQLIDGLKQKYQNKNLNNDDLRPDQLNAFLAHYNIKSGFDAIEPNQLNLKNDNLQINNDKNQTKLLLHDQNNSNNMNNFNINTNPETKVILKNSKRYRNPQEQYSNSQIVVNRPEGSVLFTLPLSNFDYNQQYLNSKTNNQDQQHHNKNNNNNNIYEYDSEPRISAETLKTVLQLSKQMLENQNLRQILPNNGYYQPIIQPMYYPIPFPSYNNNNNNNNVFNPNKNIFNSNENTFNKPELQYEKITSSSNDHNNNQKLPTTIIHNNVIPVHVSANSEKGIIQRPNTDTKSTSSLNDNNSIDSYGNKISEYIDYPPFLQPPLMELSQHNSKNFYNNQNSKPFTEILMTTEIPLLPQKYNFPKKVTISNYYTPSPHLDNGNANSVFNIERYPTISSYEQEQPIQYEQQFNEPDKIIYNSFNQQQESIKQNQNYENKNPSIIQNSNKYIENNIEQQYQQHQKHHQQQQQQQMQSEEFEDNNNQNYHKNNIKQVVTNLLTPKLDQVFYGQHQQQSNSQNSNQLVNLGGSFISYDIYKNQMLPALNNNLGGGYNNGINNREPNVEIITCSIGVRQPNITDCTKYYVCSKKDSNILTYSCPPYTGFNSQTRICDAETYAFCNPQAIISRYTVTENRKIQMEALKALQDAKRIRDEAVQAQNLANLIRYETQKVLNSTYINNNQGVQDGALNFMNSNNQAIQQQQEPIMYNNLQMKPMLATHKPFIIPHKRRKYYCREGDKVADQTSALNYFVCYKSKDGIMKGHKMTCSAGLMFCSKIKLCTLAKNCNV